MALAAIYGGKVKKFEIHTWGFIDVQISVGASAPIAPTVDSSLKGGKGLILLRLMCLLSYWPYCKLRTWTMRTLNINCSTWMDWFHGGLQFQIEHHLFPRLPRHNLRKI